MYLFQVLKLSLKHWIFGDCQVFPWGSCLTRFKGSVALAIKEAVVFLYFCLLNTCKAFTSKESASVPSGTASQRESNTPGYYFSIVESSIQCKTALCKILKTWLWFVAVLLIYLCGQWFSYTFDSIWRILNSPPNTGWRDQRKLFFLGFPTYPG